MQRLEKEGRVVEAAQVKSLLQQRFGQLDVLYGESHAACHARFAELEKCRQPPA